MKRFLDAHPKVATALHITLAALPTALLVLAILLFVLGSIFDSLLLLAISLLSGFYGFFSTGVIFVLSLLLYHFTHDVREIWPDRLRMMLIDFNIFSGFLTAIEILVIVVGLFKG